MPSHLKHSLVFKILQISCKKNRKNVDASFHMTINKIVCTAGVCFLLKFSGVWPIQKKINSMSWCTMCSLVTYTVQFNPSLHVYFISDIIVLKCVKTHVSRICYTRHSKNCVRVSICPSVCLSVLLYVRQRIIFTLCWEHF